METIASLLLAIIIGLMIVKIVNDRLSNISIKMPTVNLPNITVNMDPLNGIAQASLGTATPTVNIVKVNETSDTKPQYGGKQDNLICDDDLPDENKYNDKLYRSNTFALTKQEREKVIGPTPEPSYDHNSRPALYINEQKATLDDHYDIYKDNRNGKGTYYLDPRDMTPAQLEKFKHKAKFANMTVNDYYNWLLLFADNPEQLTAFHRANLRIISRGGKLSAADLPRRHHLPNKAEHEYWAKINNGVPENIPQPENHGYHPYNFEEQALGAKVHKRNLRHLDYVNPDEPLKTWILTRDNKKI